MPRGRLLRIYAVLIKVGWARALEYRAQLIIWLLSLLFPLIMMNVWLAVVAEGGPTAGWSSADFISYYVAAAMVNELTFSASIWNWDDEIRLGNLSMKLVKPLHPLHYSLTEQMGWKILIVAVVVPAVAAASIVFPAIEYPLEPVRLATFVASIVLGFALSYVMGTAVAMLGFWSTQAQNVYSLWWGVGQFVSGWIAPLAMFPAPIRAIASLLPFRGILGLPVEILMGRISWPDAAFGFAVSLFWIAAFAAAYRILWRRGLRRYDAVGG